MAFQLLPSYIWSLPPPESLHQSSLLHPVFITSILNVERSQRWDQMIKLIWSHDVRHDQWWQLLQTGYLQKYFHDHHCQLSLFDQYREFRLHNNDDFHGTPDENVTTINILVVKKRRKPIHTIRWWCRLRWMWSRGRWTWYGEWRSTFYSRPAAGCSGQKLTYFLYGNVKKFCQVGNYSLHLQLWQMTKH